ncbi:monovalent cation/H(+) antiporter subunit G [Pseudonocardia nantongensis]|uniref:monovalent cation/H(+) antiporter subunit G n=1 Tax=Pseudonocardia nantongensis TaxID=1181885 RepID=UPI00397E1D17
MSAAGLGNTADVVSAVLLLLGGLSCLLGALGLVRLPDLPARLQATTKPQTLGLLLILVGVAVRLEFENASTLVLVMMFQMLTAPVISQVVGRSAYRSGAIERESLVVDDLGVRMEADARAVVVPRDGEPGGDGAPGQPPGATLRLDRTDRTEDDPDEDPADGAGAGPAGSDGPGRGSDGDRRARGDGAGER